MRLIEKLRTSIKEARKVEDMEADLAKANSAIEYVAIMSDVELPDEEVEDYGIE